MRLNPDCIRDVLICVEDTGLYETILFSDVVEKLDKYDEEEVLYHINQCNYNEFFTKCVHFAQSYDGRISDLTPKAHEFLANIRSDNLWEKVKSVASKIGSVSLPILQQIATDAASSAVRGFFTSSNP